MIDMKKERTVFEDICWQLDKEENEYLPQVEISDLVSSLKYRILVLVIELWINLYVWQHLLTKSYFNIRIHRVLYYRLACI